jgi:hypothetical protein
LGVSVREERDRGRERERWTGRETGRRRARVRPRLRGKAIPRDRESNGEKGSEPFSI